MSLYRYFSAVSEVPASLPDPSGPLSKIMPSSSIEAANSKVSPLLINTKENDTCSGNLKKRGSYQKLTAEKRAEIGRRAAEHGVVSTVRYYTSKLPEELKESSVRTWRN